MVDLSSAEKMKNSNIISILKTFTPDEWKDFKRFVRSPYFNTSRPVIDFVTALSAAISSKKSDAMLEKTELFKNCYSSREYDDMLMRKLISLTNKLIEEFLAVNRTINDPLELKQKYLNEIGERNVFTGYEKHIKQAEKIYLSSETNQQLYLNKFLFDSIASQLASYDDITLFEPHKPQVKSLLNFFAFSYARLINYDLIRTAITGIGLEHPGWNMVEELYANGYFKENKAIEIFISISGLFTKWDDEESSLTILNKINEFEFEKYLSTEDRRFAYFYITQYLIIKRKKGFDIPGSKEIKWKYYKKYIELAMEAKDGLGWTMFHSAVNGGIANNDIIWVKQFVKQLRGKIILEDKDAFLATVDARILIAENNFTGGLEILSKTNPETSVIKDDVKMYTAICLYELDMFEEILNILHSYKKFLHNSAGNYPKLEYSESLKFIRGVDLLMKFRYGDSDEKKLGIKKQLWELIDSKIVKKAWIIQKLDELEK